MGRGGVGVCRLSDRIPLGIDGVEHPSSTER